MRGLLDFDFLNNRNLQGVLGQGTFGRPPYSTPPFVPDYSTPPIMPQQAPMQQPRGFMGRLGERLTNPGPLGQLGAYMMAASGAPLGEALVGMQQDRTAREDATLDREYKRAQIDRMKSPVDKPTTAQLNARMLFPNDPEKQRQYVEQVTLKSGSAGGMPSTVQEWEYYNALSPVDQRRFLEMKRAQKAWFDDVGGAKTVVTAGSAGQGPTTEVVSPAAVENEAARMRAEAEAQGRNMLQPGPQGGLTPIPGSPIAREIDAENQRKEQRQRDVALAGGTVIQDLERGLEILDKNPRASAGPGSLLRTGLGVTPADKLKDFLESAKSNIGLDRLQAMRESSPTGGALGQVPFQQQQRLEQVLGSLNVSDNPDILRDNMKRVQNIYLDIIHGTGKGPERKRLSFDEAGRRIEGGAEWRGDPVIMQSELTPGTVDSGYRFKGGNPSNPNNWEKVQ